MSAKKLDLNRRTFLQETILGGATAFLAAPSLLRTGCTSLHAAAAGTPIKRKLGKTGIELPIVSFGVMRSDSPALVHAAINAGIVHFDTAHGYQRGKNEEMLGEVFKDYSRDSFVVATKVVPEEVDRQSGIIGPGSTSKAFLERLDISLKRLNLEYVDILYVHGISSRDGALFPPMLEAVASARKTGKARHVGLSTHRSEPEVIRAAIDSGVYEVVLTSINYKQQHYADVKGAIGSAADAGIGIIAMKTMAGGFHDKERTRPINCKAALKFVLQDENITTAIPGITNFDQLAANASVNHDLTMTEQERSSLASQALQGGLYCQGCRVCVSGCAKKLPIPEIMRSYMYTYGYRDLASAQAVLKDLDLPAQPCADCSHCTARCSRGFALPERVADAVRLTQIPEDFLA